MSFAPFEEIVCYMYGKKKADFDKVNYEISKDIYEMKDPGFVTSCTM